MLDPTRNADDLVDTAYAVLVDAQVDEDTRAPCPADRVLQPLVARPAAVGDPETVGDRLLVGRRAVGGLLGLQHEIEDAQLLIDAAVAAGAPGEAIPVLDWMAQEAIEVPALRIPDAVRAAR